MRANTLDFEQHALIACQWDQAAAGWNANTLLIRAWLRQATTAMISCAKIDIGMRVLDVAAGAGDQTLDIAACVGPNGCVTATDISPVILEYAAANADGAGLHNIDICVASADDLPLKDDSFDAAICRLGLMLMPDPKAALCEIKRVLKPGARLSVLVFAGIERNPCLAIMMRVAAKHTDMPPGDPYRPGSLFSLGKSGVLAKKLAQAGFSHVVTTRLAAPMLLSTARQYCDFARESGAPVVAMLANLDSLTRVKVWAEIEEQLGLFSTDEGWSGPKELHLATGIA